MPEQILPGHFAEHLLAMASGEKEWPTSNGTRHHFIPEILLRRFRGSKAQGGKLYQLDKHDGSCKEVSPKEAGWEPNLYRVESVDGRHDGLVEGLFGLIENYAAPALTNLRSGKLTPQDRADIAFLIAIQEQRVPGALADMREQLRQSATMQAAVALANRSGSRRRRRLAAESYEALTRGGASIEPSIEIVLQTTIATIYHMACTIAGLPWTLQSTRDGQFVTSDRPVTMHDPSPPHPWSSPAWRSSGTVAATIPLSTRTCLRISPLDGSAFATRHVERQVARTNLRTYGWATRFVYGPSRELLLDLHDQAKGTPAKAPPAPTKRTVMLESLETADPEVAARNRAKGWDPYLTVRGDDGQFRTMSYEVIETLEDAMRSIAPRKIGSEKRVPLALDPVPPSGANEKKPWSS